MHQMMTMSMMTKVNLNEKKRRNKMSCQMDINVLREIKNNMNEELNKVRGTKDFNDITIEFDTTVPTYDE